jgi:hypothetical protein
MRAPDVRERPESNANDLGFDGHPTRHTAAQPSASNPERAAVRLANAREKNSRFTELRSFFSTPKLRHSEADLAWEKPFSPDALEGTPTRAAAQFAISTFAEPDCAALKREPFATPKAGTRSDAQLDHQSSLSEARSVIEQRE